MEKGAGASSMRAFRLYDPAPIETRPLRLEEVASPGPGPEQILIQVGACALCRTDLHVVEGELPVRRRPVTPGHQVVGTVVGIGPGGETDLAMGARVGVAWLHSTCGRCRFCLSGRENLCEAAAFTGWTEDGGFAELLLAHPRFVYPLPAGLSDQAVAPLLCAGIIGFRALAATGIGATRVGGASRTDPGPAPWAGARLGIYGFGAAGHLAIQIARGRGAEVYVATRDRLKHQPLAEALGAAWVGDAKARPPVPLDAAIVFAPAGDLVPPALEALDRGGTLVLGGIHMSDIPALPYRLLYGERVLRTVTNNTRQDGHRFLKEAARFGVKTEIELFPFEATPDALLALKRDGIRGAGVVLIG